MLIISKSILPAYHRKDITIQDLSDNNISKNDL